MFTDEVTLLLQLARRVNAKGDDLISEATKQYTAHVKEIMELREMWQEVGERLDFEERRFANYYPRPQVTEQRREALPSQNPPANPTNPQNARPNPNNPSLGTPASSEKQASLAEAMRSAVERMKGNAPATG